MKLARRSFRLALILGLIPSVIRPASLSEIFPFDVAVEVFPNGLKVVTVPVHPSKEICYFTIFLPASRMRPDRGGAAEAELLSRIGAETQRIVAVDYTADFISFCGRDNLADVIRAEAARLIGMSSGSPGNDADHPRDAAPSPGETIVLAAGDINREECLSLIRSAYGEWAERPGRGEPGTRTTPAAWPPEIPEPAGPAGIRFAFPGPAFSDRDVDKAALDLLAAAAFSPSSSLARRIVFAEGACVSLRAVCEDRRSAGTFVVRAVAKDEAARLAVEQAIQSELERLRTEILPSRVLADAVSNRKSALIRSAGTTGGMARVLAHYLAMTGDPTTIERLFALYDRITPVDVRNAVRRHLGPERRLPMTAKGVR